MKADKFKIYTTPDPEGPEQIAERVQRRREGFSGKIMRAFWRITGLEHLPPARKTLVFAAGAIGLGLVGLGIFTELPYSWLVTAALIILPLVFHKKEKDSETDTEAGDGPDTSSHREV